MILLSRERERRDNGDKDSRSKDSRSKDSRRHHASDWDHETPGTDRRVGGETPYSKVKGRIENHKYQLFSIISLQNLALHRIQHGTAPLPLRLLVRVNGTCCLQLRAEIVALGQSKRLGHCNTPVGGPRWSEFRVTSFHGSLMEFLYFIK